jgi:hypothetical protein
MIFPDINLHIGHFPASHIWFIGDISEFGLGYKPTQDSELFLLMRPMGKFDQENSGWMLGISKDMLMCMYIYAYIITYIYMYIIWIIYAYTHIYIHSIHIRTFLGYDELPTYKMIKPAGFAWRKHGEFGIQENPQGELCVATNMKVMVI